MQVDLRTFRPSSIARREASLYGKACPHFIYQKLLHRAFFWLTHIKILLEHRKSLTINTAMNH